MGSKMPDPKEYEEEEEDIAPCSNGGTVAVLPTHTEKDGDRSTKTESDETAGESMQVQDSNESEHEIKSNRIKKEGNNEQKSRPFTATGESVQVQDPNESKQETKSNRIEEGGNKEQKTPLRKEESKEEGAPRNTGQDYATIKLWKTKLLMFVLSLLPSTWMKEWWSMIRKRLRPRNNYYSSPLCVCAVVVLLVGGFYCCFGWQKRVEFSGSATAVDISKHSVWSDSIETKIKGCIPNRNTTKDAEIKSFFSDASVAQPDDMNHAMNRYLYFAIMHAVVLGSRFASPTKTFARGQEVSRSDVEAYLQVMLDTMKGEVIEAADNADSEFEKMNKYLYLTIVQGSVLRSKYPKGPKREPIVEPGWSTILSGWFKLGSSTNIINELVHLPIRTLQIVYRWCTPIGKLLLTVINEPIRVVFPSALPWFTAIKERVPTIRILPNNTLTWILTILVPQPDLQKTIDDLNNKLRDKDGVIIDLQSKLAECKTDCCLYCQSNCKIMPTMAENEAADQEQGNRNNDQHIGDGEWLSRHG